MAGLNRLTRLIEERKGTSAAELAAMEVQPVEDQSLFSLISSPTSRGRRSSNNTALNSTATSPLLLRGSTLPDPNKNLHGFVMHFRHNLHASALENTLLEITSEQFHQLQESSLEVLLPLIASWLYGKD